MYVYPDTSSKKLSNMDGVISLSISSMLFVLSSLTKLVSDEKTPPPVYHFLKQPGQWMKGWTLISRFQPS